MDKIRTYYLSVINKVTDEILTFGSIETFAELLGREYRDHYVNQRIKRGVMARSLVYSTLSTKKMLQDDVRELRQTRILPQSGSIDYTYSIHNNSVAIWNPTWPKVVVIEDRLIADLFRSNFELLWQVFQNKEQI